jgi:hypothetical protein
MAKPHERIKRAELAHGVEVQLGRHGFRLNLT